MCLLCALIMCADCAGCVRYCVDCVCYGRISNSGNVLCGFSILFCGFLFLLGMCDIMGLS